MRSIEDTNNAYSASKGKIKNYSYEVNKTNDKQDQLSALINVSNGKIFVALSLCNNVIVF